MESDEYKRKAEAKAKEAAIIEKKKEAEKAAEEAAKKIEKVDEELRLFRAEGAAAKKEKAQQKQGAQKSDKPKKTGLSSVEKIFDAPKTDDLKLPKGLEAIDQPATQQLGHPGSLDQNKHQERSDFGPLVGITHRRNRTG